MRLPSSQAAAQQRSINLAISSRGIAAMQAIDPAAASRFLDNVIPMHGRMIHDLNGDSESQPYDRNGQVGCIFHSLSFFRWPSCSHPCTAFVPRPEFPCSSKVHQFHRPCPSQPGASRRGTCCQVRARILPSKGRVYRFRRSRDIGPGWHYW